MSKNLQDFIEAVLFCVCIVAFLWLYCIATPPQMSAEYDLAAAEGAKVRAAQTSNTIIPVRSSTGKSY